VEIDLSLAAIKEVRDMPGRWLYHYTTLETALVHILPTLRLRLGPFSEMRDPREYKDWWPSASGFGDFDKKEFERGYAASSARLNLLHAEFKLLSTTVDSDHADEGIFGRGFARSRLWNAYAGEGTGVCLILRKEDALRTLPQQLETVGRLAHGAVHYANNAIRHELTLGFDEILVGDLDAIADRIAERHLDALFLTKNTEWESEREYRFVVRSPRQYEHVDIRSCLHAVCRGPESAKTADRALRFFASELGIGLGLVEWHNNDPTLIGLPLVSRECA
jgi:Protein of unknown function (DUF2971)